MNHNPMNTMPFVTRGEPNSERNICATRAQWWSPTLYRTEEAELVSASCTDGLLTINLTTRNDHWPQITAVNVN